ncbi:MAG: hypoxanthine phosphoribosyltransferase [Planctomycetes bacterium]|nr:hypoxanthine phosphoribosyltransferase [Planctomycetota bacterium]
MRILITAAQIQKRLSEMAAVLAPAYRDRPLTIVGVLTGSVMFLADLVRRLDMPLRIGLIQASSYRGETTTSGELYVSPGLMPDVRDRHVLLLDDILDTGQTLKRLVQDLRDQGALSVKVCVLLQKKGRQIHHVEVELVGFEIPDEFVVGYGLDYNDEYRQLPYIAVLPAI